MKRSKQCCCMPTVKSTGRASVFRRRYGIRWSQPRYSGNTAARPIQPQFGPHHSCEGIGALEGPAVISIRFDPERPIRERWVITETNEHGLAVIRASFRTQIEAERALATLVPLGKNQNAR